MAKKTIETISEIKSPLVDETKKKEILSKLKTALEIKPAEAIEQTKNIILEVEKIEQVAEEIKTDASAKTLVSAESQIKEVIEEAENEKPSNSLFDLMSKATEEDSKPEQTRLEHIADTISDEDLKDDDLDLDKDSPILQKENADITATMIVELGEVGVSSLCMWISDDWSKEAQEKKYIISAPKKKALKIAIMRVILAKKRKVNPVWSIIGVSLGACVPMLLVAFVTRRNNKKQAEEKSELIRLEIERNIQRNREAQYKYEQSVMKNDEALEKNVNDFVGNTSAPANKKVVVKNDLNNGLKVERRGRHKKDCKSYLGKKCNCK